MDDRWQPKVRRVPRLVRPVLLDPLGVAGPRRGQARGPGWRRAAHGLYVPATVPNDVPEQRILEAYTIVGERGLVTGWAALRLLGAAFFDGLAPDGRTPLPVPVVEGRARVRARPGVAVCRGLVPEDEVTVRHGIRCAIPERALLDEVRRRHELREAVLAVDMTAAAEVTSAHGCRRT